MSAGNPYRLHLSLSFLFWWITALAQGTEIFISPRGSDKNAGTKEAPLATVQMALRMARELRRLQDPSIRGGIHIIVSTGTYVLSEPIFVRPEDSGTEDSPTIIRAEEGTTP